MNKILIFIALIIGFQDTRYHKYCNQKEYIRFHEFHDTDIVCTSYQIAQLDLELRNEWSPMGYTFSRITSFNELVYA